MPPRHGGLPGTSSHCSILAKDPILLPTLLLLSLGCHMVKHEPLPGIPGPHVHLLLPLANPGLFLGASEYPLQYNLGEVLLIMPLSCLRPRREPTKFFGSPES